MSSTLCFIRQKNHSKINRAWKKCITETQRIPAKNIFLGVKNIFLHKKLQIKNFHSKIFCEVAKIY